MFVLLEINTFYIFAPSFAPLDPQIGPWTITFVKFVSILVTEIYVTLKWHP